MKDTFTTDPFAPDETGLVDAVGSFVRMTRPEFLLGGIALFWLGTRAGGTITAAEYLVAQGMVTGIQLVAQYANEYFDVEVDRDHTNRTWFSGGSGVFASGRLPPIVALRAAGVAAMVAVGFGVLAATIDWRLGVIGVCALAGSWWYSAPPLRLVAGGWGEITTAMIVGALVPLTGAVAAGDVDGRLLVSFVVPMVLVVGAMLLAVHAPDAESDAAAGKATLPVRLGSRSSMRWHRAAIGVALVSIGALAPWRPAWSTALAFLASITLLVEAALAGPRPSGLRANLLTSSAVASVALVAVGLGLGTAVP